MTETPEPRTEPTAAGSGVTRREGAAAVAAGAEFRHRRLTAVAAWVGIVAGIVFIVAVIFFSGFILGRHAGGGWHHGHHHWQGAGMSHHGGPGMGRWRFPGGPGGPGTMGPGGPGGPGGQFGPGNPYGPGGTPAPTTAPTATPHP